MCFFSLCVYTCVCVYAYKLELVLFLFAIKILIDLLNLAFLSHEIQGALKSKFL